MAPRRRLRRRLQGAGSPPTIVPIVGARTEAQVVENLGALELELDAEERSELDEAGAPELGFPPAGFELSVRCLTHTTGRWGQFWGKIDREGYPVAA